jgi:hypothetical protein
MNQLIESVNLWCDKYLSNVIVKDEISVPYLIFLYQDYTFNNELIANVYYNTLTHQYKIKNFNNRLNYCVNDMIEAIECIILISNHYDMYGKSTRFLDDLKYYIIKEGYEDYSYEISDYDDTDDWLLRAINDL